MYFYVPGTPLVENAPAMAYICKIIIINYRY